MKEEIIKIGLENGWSFLEEQANINMISFVKAIYNQKSRVNIYLTRKGRETGYYTVVTSMAHPKRGKTQLYRKGCDIKLIEKIFRNPRTHTRKGYYTNNY